ncbi:MAG: bifunctional metallophosphatase/5'-nucleotidase [Sphingobacteriales bacterium]|nr:MAG: bifunctional metallophosphatase/5'-nucleotidase [Sphingobacteriales bacterium]TAF81708.1 MAG: bifunctional metallophosphatase/5'-nucleotidase [Sphingobacteriales bacterium]
MVLNRRNFLGKAILGSSALTLGGILQPVYAGNESRKITILHTNDVHSRIDPFPNDGSPNAGKGGVAARAALIKSIRRSEANVLLLDAGDIFQGTPYFNYWGGELEIKMMSMMGYDASTMGNHDFDNGVEGFAKQLVHANFPILNANYNFTDTAMEGKSKPYQIFTKNGIKIGVFGVGIELTGLVNAKQYGATQYQNPVQKANEIEQFLKYELKCDLIICLSHLGYQYKEKKVSDIVLAQSTKHIDLIIGGHTHTFLYQPSPIKNLAGKLTLVNQVGFAGINLGRVDFVFDSITNKKIFYTSAIEPIGENSKI